MPDLRPEYLHLGILLFRYTIPDRCSREPLNIRNQGLSRIVV